MPKTSPKPADVAVTYVNINSLTPAGYNPRKWDEPAAAKLKESIKRFGLVDPLIVNGAPKRKNNIIGGHMRWQVAKEMGLAEVPVVYVNVPSERKERELNLRLNRNTGEWDFEALKSWDVEILMDVGFDDADLATIWDSALETEDDGFDVGEALEEIEVPQTKPGDIYRLGVHRLICGDATDPSVVKQLVGSAKIDVFYTDPPFNIGLNYDSGLGQGSSYGGHQTDDKKSDAEYREFLKKLLVNALAVAAPDAHLFLYCDSRYIGLIQSLYAELGLDFKRVCLWLKNSANPTPQVAFNRAYEPAVYGTRGKPYLAPSVKNLGEVLNKEVGTGNRAIDDVLDLFDIWLAKKDASSDYDHPTQKPPTLHEKPLRRCSKPGSSVLDLCAGSGSLLTACEQLKRVAYLTELEPVFCDVIIKRFEALTGQQAVRIGGAK